MMDKKQRYADLWLVVVTMFWGLSFPISKFATQFFSPYAYLALRYIMASVIIIVFFSKKLKNCSKSLIIKSIILAFIMGGGMAFQMFGLNYIDASKSGFITAMSVIMVPIFMFFAFKERQGMSVVIGVVIAYIGLYIISGTNFSTKVGIGEILTFMGAVFWTLYIVLTNHFAKQEDSLQLGIYQVLFTAVVFVLMWLIFEREIPILNSYSISLVMIAGVFCTGAAYLIFTVAQKYTTATHSALIMTFEPLFGVVFAILIPDIMGIRETLTTEILFGGGLIFLATIIIELDLLEKGREYIVRIRKNKI